MELNLRYDMNSPPFGTPHPVMYRTAIEQAAWADRLGFNQVFLAEHHGVFRDSGRFHRGEAAGIPGPSEEIRRRGFFSDQDVGFHRNDPILGIHHVDGRGEHASP